MREQIMFPESYAANTIVISVRLCLDHGASSILCTHGLESIQPCEDNLGIQNLWGLTDVTNNLGIWWDGASEGIEVIA